MRKILILSALIVYLILAMIFFFGNYQKQIKAVSLRQEMKQINDLDKMRIDAEWAKVTPLNRHMTVQLIYQARNQKTQFDTPYAFVHEESLKYLRELVREEKNSNHLAKMLTEFVTLP